jgi:hypothetical protein
MSRGHISRLFVSDFTPPSATSVCIRFLQSMATVATPSTPLLLTVNASEPVSRTSASISDGPIIMTQSSPSGFEGQFYIPSGLDGPVVVDITSIVDSVGNENSIRFSSSGSGSGCGVSAGMERFHNIRMIRIFSNNIPLFRFRTR